nr:hypothetical protein GCM10025732_36140 [Glycomyces mayteni]
MSIGWASGDHIHTVTLASSVCAFRMSSPEVALPEVLHAEREPAGGPADVPEAGGAAALVHGHPGVALLGALLDLVALGGELGEGVVAPVGDPLEPRRHPLVPSGRIGEGGARDLRVPDGLARVAPHAGDALDGLGELAVALAHEPHVPVVHRVRECDLEADAEPG